MSTLSYSEACLDMRCKKSPACTPFGAKPRPRNRFHSATLAPTGSRCNGQIHRRAHHAGPFITFGFAVQPALLGFRHAHRQSKYGCAGAVPKIFATPRWVLIRGIEGAQTPGH